MVLMLAATYWTKRAIDRRLAMRHIHASSDTEDSLLAEALVSATGPTPQSSAGVPNSYVVDLSLQLDGPAGGSTGRLGDRVHSQHAVSRVGGGDATGGGVLLRPGSTSRLDRQR